MCIHPRPNPTPTSGQLIRLPRARAVTLVTALQWRDEDVRLACLASLANSDFPPRNPGGAAARRAC